MKISWFNEPERRKDLKSSAGNWIKGKNRFWGHIKNWYDSDNTGGKRGGGQRGRV